MVSEKFKTISSIEEKKKEKKWPFLETVISNLKNKKNNTEQKMTMLIKMR